jgi:beta-galactosidase
MKQVKNVLTLMVLLIALSARADGERKTLLFNFDWKFKLGEVQNAESPTFDDADWRQLDLPHDFQVEMPWNEKANRSRGFKDMATGWYRKTFEADKTWQGKRVMLDFEGIMLHGDAYLNGQKIGGTDYGYLGFEADITKLLKWNGKNVLAVHCSTGEAQNSRWYTGGGLFRDVHLVLKDSVSIARHGIYIYTPDISKEQATVNVQVEVEGIKNKKYDLVIKAVIYDPDGHPVGETQIDAPKDNKQPTVEVQLPQVKVDNPQLWWCEKPDLYTAEVSLILNGKTIDKLSERFGIRTIEFSKDFGFKLNGKKVFLQGMANHHDLGAVGAAAYEAAIARMMDRMKEFGFNHIRTSHNPYSESFLRLADEKGILIVDELYDKWSNTLAWAGRRPWTEMWWENLMEWVKRDRNHPSVIMWSLGNELQFQEERCGFPTRDWGVTTYDIMNTLVKRLDPNRKTTVAMYPARAGGIVKHSPEYRMEKNIVPPELARHTEVASFNYCWEDYDKYMKQAPHMILYQSEATTNELTAPWAGMDRDHMVGLAYWGAIEYWGESNIWPKKGWDYSFFRHSLEPNAQAWLMKTIFKPEEPQVYIGVAGKVDTLWWNDIVVGQTRVTSHWNGEQGKQYTVYTYTNGDEVELIVNGKSLGVKKNDDKKKPNVITWKGITYEPGTIRAIARKDGRLYAEHQLETAGQPTRLVIETENPDWRADGMDLQYVKVRAVDKKGRVVPTNDYKVTFQVEGPARMIAVDNGDHSSNDLFDGNEKQLYDGFAMAIVRSSKDEPGKVKLTVSSKGLKGAAKTVMTK